MPTATPAATAAASIARIRRWLAADHQRLVIPRGAKAEQELGIHTVDDQNNVIAWHCSIDSLLTQMQEQG